MALLDDNFGRLVHGLCTQAIVELPVRDAHIDSERGCMQQQRCGSPSGVWHPFSLQTFALHRREDGNYNTSHRRTALGGGGITGGGGEGGSESAGGGAAGEPAIPSENRTAQAKNHL